MLRTIREGNEGIRRNVPWSVSIALCLWLLGMLIMLAWAFRQASVDADESDVTIYDTVIMAFGLGLLLFSFLQFVRVVCACRRAASLFAWSTFLYVLLLPADFGLELFEDPVAIGLFVTFSLTILLLSTSSAKAWDVAATGRVSWKILVCSGVAFVLMLFMLALFV